MPATKKSEKIGILEKNPNERHTVRFTIVSGPFKNQTRYGSVRQYYAETAGGDDSRTLAAAKMGNLLVDDAILPVCHEVSEALCVDVTWDDRGMRAWEKADYKAATDLAAKAARGVAVGKMFSLPVADGKATYVVTRVAGTKCDVEWRGWFNGDRYTDHYFGWGRKGVACNTVLKYVRAAEGMAAIFRQKSPNFIEAQPDGTILHYHEGFDRYVRCEVVNRPPTDWHVEEDERPEKSLKPIALIGDWEGHDLPRYFLDGSVSEGTYAGYIRTGKLIYVNPSNLYESPDFSAERKRQSDPSKLEPVDLTLPPPTPAQVAQFAAWKAVNAAKQALEEEWAETEEEQKARKGSFRKTKTWDHKDPKANLAEAERRLMGALAALERYKKQAAERASENPLSRFRFVDEKHP